MKAIGFLFGPMVLTLFTGLGFSAVWLTVAREIPSRWLYYLAGLIASVLTIVASWFFVVFLVSAQCMWIWGEHDEVVLVPLLILGAQALLVLYRVIRARSGVLRCWLPLAFAFTNLAFVFVFWTTMLPVREVPYLWLPRAQPAYDAGYHITWPSIVYTILLVAVLFIIQSRVSLPRFLSRDESH